MTRQPVQVLVIPFRKHNSSFEYCVLKRSDADYWQFVAGGAEGNETIEEAAKREAFEEIGIPTGSKVIALDSMCCVPANIFRDWDHWPKGTLVVKEFSFGVEILDDDVQLSTEHTEFKWVTYREAMKLLKWDSNRTALWELSERLRSYI